MSNLKEHVKAITLRSGAVLEQPQKDNIVEDHKETMIKEAATVPLKDELEKKKAIRSKTQKDPENPVNLSPYDPPIPFPQRLRKKNQDK